MTVILTANYLGRSTSVRVNTLERFSLIIRSIKTYIGFSKTPLTQIVRKLETDQDFSDNPFICLLNLKLGNGEDFFEAWRDSLESVRSGSRLSDDDVSLLCSFANGLGVSDLNGQLENCDMFLSLIDTRLDALRPKAVTRMKVFNSLGLLAAGLAVIILL